MKRRKPLIYWANGRWSCSIRLPSALVIGHGAVPVLAWVDLIRALEQDPQLGREWDENFGIGRMPMAVSNVELSNA